MDDWHSKNMKCKLHDRSFSILNLWKTEGKIFNPSTIFSDEALLRGTSEGHSGKYDGGDRKTVGGEVYIE